MLFVPMKTRWQVLWCTYQCSRTADRAQAMWENIFVSLVVAVGKLQEVKLNKEMER